MKQGKQNRRTAFNLSAKSMVSLMLLLIAMLIPQGVWAMDFISEIKIGADSNENIAKGYFSGYTRIDRDLNYGNGKDSYYVYLGYKTDTDASKAITGIMIVSGQEYLSDDYLQGGTKSISYNGKTWYRSPAQGSADLNKGASGDYLTIFYTRDNNTTNGGKPLVSLDVSEGTGVSGYSYAGLYKNSAFSENGNTNLGAKGAARYITYTTHTHAFTSAQITTPATCAATGLRKNTCSCGVIEEVLPIDPDAHSFNTDGICGANPNEWHWKAPEGQGTEASPYLIRLYGNLRWLSDQVRTTSNNSFYARQMNDIQSPSFATEAAWMSIGCTTEEENGSKTQHPFSGTYDGGGFLLKGFHDPSFGGFDFTYHGIIFGIVKNATIKNVGVVNANLLNVQEFSLHNAVLCGYAENSTITNCFVVNSNYSVTSSGSGSVAYTAALCGYTKFIDINGCYTNDNYPLIVEGYGQNTTLNVCYGPNRPYSSDHETDFGYTKISADDVASGALCSTMNGGKTDGTQTWYQNLGSKSEGFPRPQKNTAYTVYKVTGYKCDGVMQKEAYSNSSNAKPVDDHVYASVFTTDVEPTCTKTGSKSKHCTVCSAKTEVTTIAMLNHNMTEHAANAATSCAVAGNYKYYTCSQSCCNDKYYKDNGTHTTNTYANKEATLVTKPHTFAESDNTKGECTVCHHGFLRYTSDEEPFFISLSHETIRLKDANGNELSIVSKRNGEIEFNKPLVIIGAYAFQCETAQISDLILPNTVTTIEHDAFDTWNNLSGKLMIPKSVKTIGHCAFFTCDGLSCIEFRSIPQVETRPNGLVPVFAYTPCNKTVVLSNDSYVYKGSSPDFPGVQSVTAPCSLDLTGSVVANHTNLALTHGESIVDAAVAATCTTAGLTEGSHCNLCNKPFVAQQTIPALDHNFTSNTLTASPGEDGLYAYACDNGCGAHSDAHVIKDFNGINNNLELTMDSNGNYSTSTAVTLEDAVGFVSPVPFTAASITYERTLASGKWGTLCLPYALSAKEGYEYFTLSGVSSEAVTLSKIDGAVPAGTPVLVRRTDADNLSLTENDVLVGISTNPASAIEGLQLQGTFEPKPVTTGYYLDASDGFLHSIDAWCTSNGALTIPAFRAWFGGSISSGAPLRINIDDEEAMAISAISALTEGNAEIYDMNGRRLQSLQKGVNIMKYGNGKSIKVNIK